MTNISRRRLCGASISLGAGILIAPGLLARSPAPTSAQDLARVIVDNDFAGDPDGLAGLGYQLLSPTTRTVLVTTSALDAKLAKLAGTLVAGQTAARGAVLARELTGRLPSTCKCQRPCRAARRVTSSSIGRDLNTVDFSLARVFSKLPGWVCGPRPQLALDLKSGPEAPSRHHAPWRPFPEHHRRVDPTRRWPPPSRASGLYRRTRLPGSVQPRAERQHG